MKRLIYSVALVAAMASLSACNKSSDGKRGESLSMTGTWAPKANATGDVNLKDYKDFNEVAPGSYGFALLDINADGTVMLSTQGVAQAGRSTQTALKVMTIGKLDNAQSEESKFHFDRDYIQKTAKEAGVPEEEIQKAVANTCTYTLKSQTELISKCSDDANEVSVYTRIDAGKKTKMLNETGAAMAYVEREKKALKADLAGKTFVLVKTTFSQENKAKEKIESSEDAEQIAKKEDETGEGDQLFITPKKVSFAPNFESALVNEKRQVEISIRAGYTFDFTVLQLDVKTSERSFVNVVGGKYTKTADGFEISKDFQLNGQNVQMSSRFQLVP